MSFSTGAIVRTAFKLVNSGSDADRVPLGATGYDLGMTQK